MQFSVGESQCRQAPYFLTSQNLSNFGHAFLRTLRLSALSNQYATKGFYFKKLSYWQTKLRQKELSRKQNCCTLKWENTSKTWAPFSNLLKTELYNIYHIPRVYSVASWSNDHLRSLSSKFCAGVSYYYCHAFSYNMCSCFVNDLFVSFSFHIIVYATFCVHLLCWCFEFQPLLKPTA